MIKHLLYFSVLVSMLFSCDTKLDAPDVSGVSPDYELVRFDQRLRNLDTNDLEIELIKLQEEYPQFSGLYFSSIVPLINENSIIDNYGFKAFITNDKIRFLLDTVHVAFEDFTAIDGDFKKAAQYLRFYFPDNKIPRFYTLISDYGFQNFIFSDKEKDGIGIGLDFFLGSDYPYKALDPSNPSYSDYLTRTYNKDHIVRKSFGLIVDDIVGAPNGKRMLDIMINEGKKLYILEKILPFKPDTIILEYSQEQMNWAYDNELEIWSFFLDKELLYETSHLKTNRYINPAPNSSGMPAESPGRTAIFIGKQIVKRYMDKFPETTIDALLANYDAQKILEESKYKPRRK